MGGCKRKALALASVALGVLMVPCAAFSFSSLVPKFTSYPWSFVHPCPLRRDPVPHLKALFNDRFRSQEAALQTIVESVESWHADLTSGTPHPLVLGITGSTGVGKTLAAVTIAEAILGRSRNANGRLGTASPTGMLWFRGEDFSDPSSAERSYDAMKSALHQHVVDCGGNAVVVVDEAQKALPRALDALAPAMERSQPVVAGVDYSRVVFIIISDIGIDKMEAHLVSIKDSLDRDLMLVSFHKLHKSTGYPKWIGGVLKGNMNAQWGETRLALHLAAVVAFLPFTPDTMESIVKLHMDQLGQQLVMDGTRWQQIVFEPTVSKLLASPPFIDYRKVSLPPAAKGKAEESFFFSTYGARDVVGAAKGPIKRMRAAIAALSPPVVKAGQGGSDNQQQQTCNSATGVCASKSTASPSETTYRVLFVGPAPEPTSGSTSSSSASGATAFHMRACRHVDGLQCVTVLQGGI